MTKTTKYNPHYLSIKYWAEEDRPREKMLLKGKHHLTDAELIAIIIGSGTRQETALDLAKRILNQTQNNINNLGKLSIKELTNFKGIGTAKAISIVAALELGRRRKLVNIDKKPMILSSKDAYGIVAPVIAELGHEEFWILLLNQGNRVIDLKKISTGSINKTLVDAKNIFNHALAAGACSVILCHNHPSGMLQPSDADIQLTKKLKAGGELLDILVMDHLIVSESGYLSFVDEGLVFG